MKINLVSPFFQTSEAPELARRFALILAGLAAVVARRFLRMPHLMGLTGALYGRLVRLAQRFERGLTRTAKQRAARVGNAGIARVRAVALPSGRGWLVRELGWEAAGYGCQLEALLAEPAMQAALADMPGLGRVLRPLCRMLGVVAPVVAVVAVAAEPAVEVASACWSGVVQAVLPPAVVAGPGVVFENGVVG